jgi:WD40 repeat protein
MLRLLMAWLLMALAQSTAIIPENAAQITELGVVTINIPYPNNIVNDVTFSPNGETFALGRTIRAMELRDIGTLDLNEAFQGESRDHTGMSLAFSPDGSILAVGEGSGDVRLWDTGSGVQTGLIEGGENTMFDVTFTPDGAMLAAADGAYVWIWDAATGENLAVLGGAEDFVSGVAISPDGRSIAATSWDGVVRVWNFESAASIAERYRLDHGENQGAYGIAFSPDGSLLASGGDGKIYLWDAASGTERATFTLDLRSDGYPAVVWDLDFNLDGSLVAAAVDENGPSSVLLWDIEAGREMVKLAGHQDAVTSVEFNADGTLLASAGADGTARLWGIRSIAATCTVTAPSGVNIRSGRSTDFDVIGSLATGESAEVDGQAEGTDGFTWYRLTDGGWVRSDVVDGECGNVAVVTP